MLYAKTLDKLIRNAEKEGQDVNIAQIARDGKAITQAIIGEGGYKSISGNDIVINANGDSEGNFTAFALKRHNYTYVSEQLGITFYCNYYPVKVSQ